MESPPLYADYLDALRRLGSLTTVPASLMRSTLYSRYPQFLVPDEVNRLFDDWQLARVIKPPHQRELTQAKTLYANYLDYVEQHDRWAGLVGPRMFNEMLDDLEFGCLDKRRRPFMLNGCRAFKFGLRSADTDDMGL